MSNKPAQTPWYIANLIAGLDATPTQKYLLTLIHQHTHSRKGYAWTKQETLAQEMCVDLSTAKRGFRWGKKRGIVGVRRIRTGKGKDDQYNEYWLVVERLEELQRPPQHRAPMTPAQHEAGVKSDLSRGHLAPGAWVTHDPEVLEVKQGLSKSSDRRFAAADDYPPLTTDALKKAVLQKCEDPGGTLAATLDIIIERAQASGVQIRSAKYLETALQNFNFESGNDREELLRRLRVN